MPDNPGTLYVIATPIGNLEDISLRALRVLGEVDVLACEDTRHTPRLLERHNVRRPPVMVSYHEHNERSAAERILAMLADGKAVGVVTNAGYPGVSDPGYRIVSQASEAGYRIEVIPGAGAVEAALLASGLPSSSYTFKGFAPKTDIRRRKFIEAEAALPHTLIFFESPHRVLKLLEDSLLVLGDRKAAVCVELTKAFENVRRGYLSQLVEMFRTETIRGEVAIVIAGANPKFRANEEEPDEPLNAAP